MKLMIDRNTERHMVLTWLALAAWSIIVAGCGGVQVPITDETRGGTSISTADEIQMLSKQMREFVTRLECSDAAASDFTRMVTAWEDKEGQPVILVWKRRLSQAREDHKRSSISEREVTEVEEATLRECSQRIRKEIDYAREFLDWPDLIIQRRASCHNYCQLLYVLGDSIGLAVTVVNVTEELRPNAAETSGHAACLVRLTDGSTIMADLAFGTISKPFELEKEFAKDGDYLQLRDRTNPLGLHLRIQFLDTNGVIATTYNNRGNVYCEQSQFTNAISQFDRALVLNPRFAPAYYNRARAYDAMGQKVDAISDYTRAIELDPKFGAAYNNRGRAYAISRELAKAISDFDKAIQIDPRWAMAYYNRANAYMQKGNMDQALLDCTKAIEIDPKLAPAYSNRGLLYWCKGEYDRAIWDYDKAIELNPGDAKAYSSRGFTYAAKGEYDRAISDYMKAIQLYPRYSEAYYNLGNACLNKGNYNQALVSYSKAIEINPKYAEAYGSRGLVYAASGKSEQAKKDLLKAVELKPSLKSGIKQISDQFKLGL